MELRRRGTASDPPPSSQSSALSIRTRKNRANSLTGLSYAETVSLYAETVPRHGPASDWVLAAGPALARVEPLCLAWEEVHDHCSPRGADARTPGGIRFHKGAGSRRATGPYLTSDLITYQTPTTSGITSQIIPVAPMCAHSSPVGVPLNSAPWA